MNRIGIDLGGTKIEGILTDETYKTITRKRVKHCFEKCSLSA